MNSYTRARCARFWSRVVLRSMIEPVGPDEQPHPIRRAAANLSLVHRYVCEQDDRAPEAITLSGILMALDRSVRNISNAAVQADLGSEARLLAKHADTVDRMREEISHTPRKSAQGAMREAHDALIEAARKLEKAQPPFSPF
jgi:hypothetical protein